MKNVLKFMKDNNADGRYDKILKDLSKLENPKLTDLLNIVEKYNDDDEFLELLDLINDKYTLCPKD